MSQHWETRLDRVLKKAHARQPLRRAEKRQLRKLLGRQTGREWRSAGNQIFRNGRRRLARTYVNDQLALTILENMQENGTIWDQPS